jgi:hypothetical protein
MTRNLKDAGTIESIASHFEGKGGRNKKTSLGNTKELKKLVNLGKSRDGITKIERSKIENQQTKKQTNEKQSRRRQSNPTDEPKFQRCRKNCKHRK